MNNHNQLNRKSIAFGISCSGFVGAALGISAGELGVWSILGIAISVAVINLIKD